MLFTSELEIDLQQLVKQVKNAHFVVDFFGNPNLPAINDPTSNINGNAYMHTIVKGLLEQHGFADSRFDAANVLKPFAITFSTSSGNDLTIKFAPDAPHQVILTHLANESVFRTTMTRQQFLSLPYEVVGYLAK